MMPFVIGITKPLACLTGCIATVFAGEMAVSAEPKPDNVLGCWNRTATADDGQTEINATLCFNTDDKYSLSTRACFHYPQEPNYPCERWRAELSYHQSNKLVELQTLATYGTAEKSFCKQDIADFDQIKFVACSIPGVEWTKQPVSVEGK